MHDDISGSWAEPLSASEANEKEELKTNGRFKQIHKSTFLTHAT